MKFPWLPCVFLALPISTALAANAKIIFEAEKPLAIASPFRKMSSKAASGGAYLEIPWDGNRIRAVGHVIYKFNVKTPGDYIVWARTYWVKDEGNSLKISVNGDDDKILGEDGTLDSWHWVGGKARVKLHKGVNTLTLKLREMGVRVDQFFLTQEIGSTGGAYRKAVPSATKKPSQ